MFRNFVARVGQSLSRSSPARGFAVCAALVLSAPAGAAVTFDFSGGSGAATSYSFDTDGISLTVWGGHYAGAEIRTSAQTGSGKKSSVDFAMVTRDDDGLGVEIGHKDQGGTDGHRDTDDVIVFDFGSAVRIIDLVFGDADNSDDFRLFGGDLTLQSSFSLSGSHHDRALFSFSDGWTTSRFGIGAIDINDNFRILSLTVDRIVADPSPELPGVPGVPEPSTWLMMIVGWGLALSLSRRRGRRVICHS